MSFQINAGILRVCLSTMIFASLWLTISSSVFAQQNRGAIVQAERVEKMTLPNFTQIGGSVVAGDPFFITASLTAKIVMKDWQIGDPVKAGDIIATQDTFAIEHQLQIPN